MDNYAISRIVSCSVTNKNASSIFDNSIELETNSIEGTIEKSHETDHNFKPSNPYDCKEQVLFLNRPKANQNQAHIGNRMLLKPLNPNS